MKHCSTFETSSTIKHYEKPSIKRGIKKRVLRVIAVAIDSKEGEEKYYIKAN